MKQLHKKFKKEEVVEVFERYLSREIGIKQAKALLGLGKSRFFDLLRVYRESPNDFSLEYQRKGVPRKISEKWEKKIVGELKKEAAIIRDKENPVKNYNYSYVREILETKHKVSVSLPTIIARAKKMGFIRKRDSGRVTIGKF
jgi:transposase